MLGGQIQVVSTAVSTALPQIKYGKLRLLMVTAEKRVAALPDVPPAVEAVLPKMVAHYWVAFAAPAKTPPAIVDRLNKAIVTALATPEVKKRYADLGLDPVGAASAQAAKFVDDEIQVGQP